MRTKSGPSSQDRQEQLAALFRAARVIPVLTIERPEDAVPLARALVVGRVRVLEVTLRTPVAIAAARAIMADVPEAVVGIGTILNPDGLVRAEALGAAFGISPGATPDLLRAAAASTLPFAPGIATASVSAALITLVFAIIHLPYALLLGPLSVLLSLVPYIGVALGILPPLLVALMQYDTTGPSLPSASPSCWSISWRSTSSRPSWWANASI